MIDVRAQSSNIAVALGGIVSQSLQCNNLEIGVNLSVESAKPRRLVRLQGLSIIDNIPASLEVSASREHLIKDGSDAIDVSALVDILARFSLLRRHVLERADNMAS